MLPKTSLINYTNPVLKYILILVVGFPLFGYFSSPTHAQTETVVAEGNTDAASSTGQNSQRKVARTSDGTIWVVYVRIDGKRQVYLAHSTDNGVTWTEEKFDEEESKDQSSTSIAVDSDDNLHIFWGRGTFGSTDWTLLYRKRSTSGWETEPFIIADTSVGAQLHSSVAIDAEDNVHVAWSGGGWDTQSSFDIQYRKKTQEGWQEREAVTDNSQDQWIPSIVVDGNGSVHVVWFGANWFGSGTGFSNSIVVYRKRTDGGWQDVEAVTTVKSSSLRPSLFVDEQNVPHVAWESLNWGEGGVASARNILYNNREAGDWGDPVLLTEKTSSQFFASIAQDGQGDIHIAWYGLGWEPHPSHRNILHIKKSGNTWSEITPLTSIDQNNYVPNLIWSNYPVTSDTNVKWSNPERGFAFIWNNNDANQIKYYASSDLAWNEPPEGDIKINGGDKYTNKKEVTLNLEAEDNVSPQEDIQVLISNNSDFAGAVWQSYESTVSWELSPGDGEKKVYIKYRDKAGNITLPIIGTINLDRTKGEGEITINDGEEYTNKRDITLHLTAQGVESKITQMQISETSKFTNAVWEPYQKTKGYKLGDDQKRYRIYVRYKDEAGNITSSDFAEITLDTTRPVIETVTINNQDTTPLENESHTSLNQSSSVITNTHDNIAITIEGIDNLSGIQEIKISEHPDHKGIGWTKLNTEETVTDARGIEYNLDQVLTHKGQEYKITITNYQVSNWEGIKLIYITVRDKAQNHSLLYTTQIEYNPYYQAYTPVQITTQEDPTETETPPTIRELEQVETEERIVEEDTLTPEEIEDIFNGREPRIDQLEEDTSPQLQFPLLAIGGIILGILTLIILIVVMRRM